MIPLEYKIQRGTGYRALTIFKLPSYIGLSIGAGLAIAVRWATPNPQPLQAFINMLGITTLFFLVFVIDKIGRAIFLARDLLIEQSEKDGIPVEWPKRILSAHAPKPPGAATA